MAKWAEGTSPYDYILVRVSYKYSPNGDMISWNYRGGGRGYFVTDSISAINWITPGTDSYRRLTDYKPLELGELHETDDR